jgi:hypothetical protein
MGQARDIDGAGVIYSENDRLSDKGKTVKMPDIPIIHLVG